MAVFGKQNVRELTFFMPIFNKSQKLLIGQRKKLYNNLQKKFKYEQFGVESYTLKAARAFVSRISGSRVKFKISYKRVDIFKVYGRGSTLIGGSFWFIKIGKIYVKIELSTIFPL
ncbi:hypothetical protein NQ314_011873 [Rhamnusium bicolor]|uniref:Ribosomal protein S3 n=1 Tax=Rhamnusium bicolor TaxID=1586634 RepID=A0AAV8XFQ6_9CUCU|nr:hypothetical protein NQ314_011873 [Rhamnusium bicolor]